MGWGLLIGSLLGKVIGALYRLPLTNLLGALGMGDYQLVFAVYALLLAVTSAAVPVLLSREIGKDGGRWGYAVFWHGRRMMMTVGVPAALLLMALSYPLALWQGNPSLWIGYCTMAPAVWAVGLAACYKGWFAAGGHTGTLVGIGLVEQIVKLSGLGLAYWWSNSLGAAWAPIGALCGVMVAEVLALVWCVCCYRVLGYGGGKPQVHVGFAPLWKAMLPLTASQMVMPAVTFVDSLLLVNYLVWWGAERGVATAQYGLLTGAVGTVINLPVVLTLSFVTTVVPAVSGAVRNRNIGAVRSSSGNTLYTVVALSLPCAVGLAMLAQPTIAVLYPRLTQSQLQAGALLLAIGSLGIPLMAVQQLYGALLVAVDRSKVAAKHLALGGAVKLLLDLALVPPLGIVGAAVANVGCYAVALGANVLSYRRLCGRVVPDKDLTACAAAGLIMAAVLSGVRFLPNNLLRVAVGVLLGGAVYAIIMLCVRRLNGAKDKGEVA